MLRYITKPQSTKNRNDRHWLLPCSIVSKLMRSSALVQRHGTVDVLVNNAGKAAWTGQGPTDGAPEQ